MRIHKDGVYKVFFVSNLAASSSIFNLRAILKTTIETIIIIQKILLYLDYLKMTGRNLT